MLVNGGADGEPDAANILDALGLLSKATVNDTVLMFVSGHGMNEGLSYNFLATDAAWGEDGLRRSTIVPWAIIQLEIARAKGRRFLFLDTCHSGNRYDDRLLGEAYQANIIVYSAARWDQEAVERSDVGHAVFTYAVAEGIKGAAKNGAGEVHAKGLFEYLRARVRELAAPLKREQEPQYFRAGDAEDYLLARGQ